MDLALFKLLARPTKWKAEALMRRLYEVPNPTAYHALRKRLMRHLSDFIVLKQMGQEETPLAGMMGQMAMARHLFEHNLSTLGWEILIKAEKKAIKQEAYEELNSIYLLQLAHAGVDAPYSLSEILQKHQTNKHLAEEEERAIIALSLVQHALQQAKNQGHVPDFAQIITDIQASYGLTGAINKRPSLFYRFMAMARAAVLVNKDFHAFAPFLDEQYTQMANQGAFKPHHITYQLELLYMLAHVWYRCKHFDKSNELIKTAEEMINESGKGIKDRFYAKFTLLNAANLTYLNQSGTAVVILEELCKKPLSLAESLDAKFSLSFCYFLLQQPKKALPLDLGVRHSDNWLIKKMGPEWVLKKSAGEIILQYELGNEEIALNRIYQVRRKFSDLLEMSQYANVVVYLKLIEQMIKMPDKATSKQFYEQIQSNIHYLPFEEEDLQYLSFYAWLKAKVVQKPFNQVLQELLGFDFVE